MENTSETPEIKPAADEPDSVLNRFSKSSQGAKLGGTFHKTAGLLKRKLGEITEDTLLKEEGRNQMLLGKVYHLVGDFRSVREMAEKRIQRTKKDLEKVLREHSGHFLDGASKFVDDVKKAIF